LPIVLFAISFACSTHGTDTLSENGTGGTARGSGGSDGAAGGSGGAAGGIDAAAGSIDAATGIDAAAVSIDAAAGIDATAGNIDAAVGSSGTGWATVHNDFFWYDLTGNRINVRSGTLRKFGDVYYWYGSSNGFRDQTCYTSADLVHWTSKGVALRTALSANRMDVLYNAATNTYVMFLKYDGDGANLGIATASAPEGPYTFLGQTLVDGALMGDMSVYQDDDGQAYLAYVSWKISTNGSHGIYRMSADYQTLATRVFYWTTGGREAPHIFKRDGTYYYGTSRTAFISPTATQYYRATNLGGPWSAPIGMNTPGSGTSYETQVDFVFPFTGTQRTFYMYDGDRWIKTGGSQGDYVWLPMEFDAMGVPSMTYYQDWDFNPTTGAWRPFDLARDLALGKNATASSVNGTNVAANVTTATTYQNYTATRWESSASDPQWVMVDLGTSVEIDRVILKWHTNYASAFSIETSTNATTWSTVYSTTNGASYSVTDVTFGKTSARYVRMNGTRRGTQNGYSVFSFMVLDDP
jgi:hypothetical protein